MAEWGSGVPRQRPDDVEGDEDRLRAQLDLERRVRDPEPSVVDVAVVGEHAERRVPRFEAVNFEGMGVARGERDEASGLCEETAFPKC